MFKTTSGVRQGGPESPILFTLFIDFVIRIFMEKAKQLDINFYQHNYRINLRSLTRDERYQLRNNGISTNETSNIPWSGYADDFALFLLDKAGLSSATELLDNVFISFGLR